MTSLILDRPAEQAPSGPPADGATEPGRWSMLLPLALLVLSIIGLTITAITRTMVTEKAEELARLQAIADIKTRQLSDWLQERHGEARFLQQSRYWAEVYRRWRPGGDTASRDQMYHRLNEYRSQDGFRDVMLLDERGSPLWSAAGEPLSLESSLTDYIRDPGHRVEAGHFGPYLDGQGRLRLDFLAPMREVGGSAFPLVLLRTDPTDYLSLAFQAWPVPNTSGEILLVRREGGDALYINELRFRPDSATKLRASVNTPKLLAAKVLRGEIPPDNRLEGVDYRGVPVTGVVRPVPETDWFLIAKLDQAELNNEITRSAHLIALAGLLALAATAAGAYLYHLRQQLVAARRVEAAQAEKLKAMQLLDILVENSADTIFVKDAQGRYQIVNQAGLRLLGKSRAEVLGRDDREILPPEVAAALMANDQQVMAEDQASTYEEELMTTLGRRTFLTTKGPIRDAQGRLLGVFGISHDITVRQQADAELKRSNAELAQIAYITSHDLQEPLRTVGSFVQLLARRNRGRLDADSDQFIDFAVDGVARMQAIIQDILAFSWAANEETRPDQQADAAAALDEALANLRAALDEAGAHITRDPLPAVAVAPRRVVQLFQNLIGNALKFRSEAPPAIHISAAPDGQFWRFCVADNGIGIDPRYHDRIFVLFQRLHGRAEYGGTGIGLALCKKIVERHGGRIWVESAAGQGAKFYFTLPKAME